tara:strand:- start:2570 stop:3160 length:591 start_codon:yes stop_codon:yes gene_type:complete
MVERRIKAKIDSAFSEFKDEMRQEINNNITSLISKNVDTFTQPDYEDALKKIQISLIQKIYNHEIVNLTEEDFRKRKRIKNAISLEDRCTAYRANKMQCSRRKLGDNAFCGTHLKGQPHGVIKCEECVTPSKNTTVVSIWPEDIKGIIYYIDKDNNVYSTEDIQKNVTNPKIIAKYQTDICNETGNIIYSIPEFNI